MKITYKNLPKSPGVYFFKNADGAVIYIGKAKSLRSRVSSYFHPPTGGLLPKTASLVAEIATIDYLETDSEIDALLLEANLIRKHAPKYNVSWKDGKAYPLIEITIKEEVPLVKIARQESANWRTKAIYFGPYPTGSDLLALLRFLRRIFPFVSQKHLGNKPCLRSHLGLCPCPNVFFDRESRLSYLRNLRYLRSFLSGKRQTVQKKLQKKMSAAAKAQNFEEAARIKKQLGQIAYVTASRTLPWEYETNPNLTSDRLQESLRALRVLLGLPVLRKVECYDVSNTSGKQATGAQAVFVDGSPEKSLYRRYKIKLNPPAGGPDDLAMIREVLSRRLKSDIPLPELIVIDGGVGQVNAANSVLSNVAIVGLAKRLEEIYLPNGRKVLLPAASPALHLLQQLRDEAHRFSRQYHFWLRREKMLT